MTPQMVRPVFDELAAARPRRHFTVGIVDDVTHLSLPIDATFRVPRPAGEVQALFFGLGSDGTVGANKASVKIIGEGTDLFAQGYFVYDSKKSGSVTTSHLRFGPEPIRSTYLVEGADFVACHQFGLLERSKVLDDARDGATFLLNAPYPPDQVWAHLPRHVQQQLVDKHIELWVIDAFAVAAEVGMGNRINTVMQPCFFHLAGVLPAEEAIARIKASVEQTYAKRGEAVVQRNFAAIDRSLERLSHVPLGAVDSDRPVAVAGPRRRPGLRAPGDRGADGRRRRSAAGQRDAGRRHLPHGHGALREAGHRADDPRLGCVDLHRLWQVRHGLPALLDPDEGLPDRGGRGRTHRVPEQGVQVPGPAGPSPDHPGRARRLHRLRRVRRRLPRQEQDRGASQGHQHGAGRREPRHRAPALGLLLDHPAARPEPAGARHHQGLAGPGAAVRVLGSLRRLRRDALPEAGEPAVRRSHGHRQRDRLLLDLRRQPADHALDRQRRGSRTGLGQLPVRGQRRVRPGHAPGARRPGRATPDGC